MTIGERIRYYRKKRGYTQQILADMTGIHPVSIRKYETDKMEPKPAQIQKIAEALNISASALSEPPEDFKPKDIHLTNKGELYSLLMNWHKSGILTIQGIRSPEHKMLIPETVHFIPHPALASLFNLQIPAEDDKSYPLNRLWFVLNDNNMLNNMLDWESAYFVFLKCLPAFQKIIHTDKVPIDIFETLEHIELHLQEDPTPLDYIP